ncbi:hypothetical protein FDU21_21865 [Xanthomonas oryzae pv. oryzae]|nr:hypothetical protein FDU21_21865 [Xanthomonas oryzae pv. oryzae]
MHSSGRYLQFNYDQEGRLTQVATSAGQIVSYAYNSDRTLETADRDGDIERYSYISYGGSNTLLTRVEDGGGSRSHLTRMHMGSRRLRNAQVGSINLRSTTTRITGSA